MADKKISDLNSATSLTAGSTSEFFVVVQAGETKKITPTVLQNSLYQLEDSEDLSAATGATAISNLTDVSFIRANGGSTSYTLAAPSAGQAVVKTLLLSSFTTTGTTITVTNAAWGGSGIITMTATRTGLAMVLKYVGSKWYLISNNSGLFAGNTLALT